MGSALGTEFSWRKHAVSELWVAALKTQRSRSSLADGEVLARLVPETIEQLLTTASDAASRGAEREELPPCDCGINPYHTFYAAGQRAMATARAIAQRCEAPAGNDRLELEKLGEAMRRQGRLEIDLFCQVCVRRNAESGCRFAQNANCGSRGRHVAAQEAVPLGLSIRGESAERELAQAAS